jgi:hypothetical protein
LLPYVAKGLLIGTFETELRRTFDDWSNQWLMQQPFGVQLFCYMTEYQEDDSNRVPVMEEDSFASFRTTPESSVDEQDKSERVSLLSISRV